MKASVKQSEQTRIKREVIYSVGSLCEKLLN